MESEIRILWMKDDVSLYADSEVINLLTNESI